MATMKAAIHTNARGWLRDGDRNFWVLVVEEESADTWLKYFQSKGLRALDTDQLLWHDKGLVGIFYHADEETSPIINHVLDVRDVPFHFEPPMEMDPGGIWWAGVEATL